MNKITSFKNILLTFAFTTPLFVFSQTYDVTDLKMNENQKNESSLNDEFQQELSPFYLHGQLKTMHLWRGIAVTNSTVFAIDAGVGTNDGKLKAGVWGGYGTTGEYREFDYYAIYSPVKNLTFALWDIYNYSTNATWNNKDFFEYNADKTGHFLDLSVSYTLSDKVPLNLYWSTVIHGRDRGLENEKNLYSSYVQASYPVVKSKAINLDLYAAAAFALSSEKEDKGKNFYGPKSGLANVGFIVGKTLNFGRYQLPITATASWSPINDSGNIQLAFNIF
ncbi:hypothetical protein [Chishuiella sp.]|uniref:hypothetical protein n=1 Tax=Chishuiella sp. TaxID=1969467 RepID=UPI0028B2280E|nr:hypothetical protein [Chishuiella sp.]